MSGRSNIQWTEATWNPVRGCTKTSPGCANCYAETFAERFRGVKGHAYEQGFDLRLVPEKLEDPLHWKQPKRVFVNSMSDLFHDDVPFDFIIEVFRIMAQCPKHTFQVLTKRATGMFDVVRAIGRLPEFSSRWPLPNVWLGVSVENQHFADERIPWLLQTPAAVRFISAEPLLGPVDLTNIRPSKDRDIPIHSLKCIVPRHLDWVICGGESGHEARPLDLAWARSLRDQCKSAGVAFFMKQLGSRSESRRKEDPPFEELFADKRGEESAGIWALADRGHHGDMDEFPPDLRIREYPEGHR